MYTDFSDIGVPRDLSLIGPVGIDLLAGLERLSQELDRARGRSRGALIAAGVRCISAVLRPEAALASMWHWGRQQDVVLQANGDAELPFDSAEVESFALGGKKARTINRDVFLRAVGPHGHVGILCLRLRAPIAAADLGCAAPFVAQIETELTTYEHMSILAERCRFLRKAEHRHLRPNAIYYNLLRMFERVFEPDHSALLVASDKSSAHFVLEGGTARILAEKLLWKGAGISHRIGQTVELGSGAASQGTDPERLSVLVSPGPATPTSVLMTPIEMPARGSAYWVVVFDSRAARFDEDSRTTAVALIEDATSSLVRLAVEGGLTELGAPDPHWAESAPGPFHQDDDAAGVGRASPIDYVRTVDWIGRRTNLPQVTLLLEAPADRFQEYTRQSGGATRTSLITDAGSLVRDVLMRGSAAAAWFDGDDDATLRELLGGVDLARKDLRVAIAEPVRGGVLLGFNDRETEFVERLTFRHLALSLDERLRHRDMLSKLRVLSDLTMEIADAVAVEDLRRSIVDAARSLLDGDFCYLWSVDSVYSGVDTVSLRFRVASPAECGLHPRDQELSCGISGRAARTREVQVAPDVTNDPDFEELVDDRALVVPISTEIAIPLLHPQTRQTLAVLGVAWKTRRRITDMELGLCSILARVTAPPLAELPERRVADTVLGIYSELLRNPLHRETSTARLIEWFLDHVGRFIPSDTLTVWSLAPDDDDLVLALPAIGDREQAYRANETRVPVKGSFIGWLALNFHQRGVRAARDNHGLSGLPRYQVPGTPEVEQSILAAAARLDDDRTTWVVCLDRFDGRVFDREEQETLERAIPVLEESVRQKIYTDQLPLKVPGVTTELIERVLENPYSAAKLFVEMVVSGLGCASVDLTHPVQFGHTSQLESVRLAADGQPPAPIPSSVRARILREIRFGGVTRWSADDADEGALGPELRSFLSHHWDHGERLVEARWLTDEEGRFQGVLFVGWDDPTKADCKESRSAMDELAAAVGTLLGVRVRQLALIEERTLTRVEELVRNAMSTIAENPEALFEALLNLALDHIAENDVSGGDSNTGRMGYCGNIYVVAQRDKKTVLVQRANRGPSTDMYPRVQELSEGIVGKVAASGYSHYVEDAEDPDIDYLPFLKGMRSEFALPIMAPRRPGAAHTSEERVIGVINVESPNRDAFSYEQRQFLGLLADRFGLVVQMGQLHEETIRVLRQREETILTLAVQRLLHNFRKIAAYYPTGVTTIANRLLQGVRDPLGQRQSDAGVFVHTNPMAELDRLIDDRARESERVTIGLKDTELRDIVVWLHRFDTEARGWTEVYDSSIQHLRDMNLGLGNKIDLFSRLREIALHQTQTYAAEGIELDCAALPQEEFALHVSNATDVPTVAMNLLSNSRRALLEGMEKAPPGHRPRIWLSGRVERKLQWSYAYVEIGDNGPGFPAESRERMFRWSAMLQSSSNRTSLGIGLAIVREIMSVLGGEVELVESEPYGATVFRLNFRTKED